MLKYNPVKYVFLNKSLHMSIGKACAQVGHAVAMSIIQNDNDASQQEWYKSPHRTIIVLEARDEAHMRSIGDYLADRGIITSTIVDEGVNEIDPHTITAMATTILNKNDEYVSAALSTFSLYKDTATFTINFDR